MVILMKSHFLNSNLSALKGHLNGVILFLQLYEYLVALPTNKYIHTKAT
jgi:hypothetical protein